MLFVVYLCDKEGSSVRRHILNAFREGENEKDENNVHFLHVNGVKKPVPFYSLDVIISVGYRVNSKNATRFRQWANNAGIIYYSVTVLLLNCLANGNRLLDSEAPIKIISSAASHM